MRCQLERHYGRSHISHPDTKYLYESERWDLSKVQELTIDFSKLCIEKSAHVFFLMTFWGTVRHYVNHFRNLKKLIVVVHDEEEDQVRSVHEDEPSSSWYTRFPTPVIDLFENQDLKLIQQALGLYPKLSHVRPVSIIPTYNKYVSTFRERIYGSDPVQPITWIFFQTVDSKWHRRTPFDREISKIIESWWDIGLEINIFDILVHNMHE